MSKFLLKDNDGKYRKKTEDSNICKYKINGICCNEKSEYYGYFPMKGPFSERKCNCKRSCELYESEHVLKIKRRKRK